MNKFRIAIAAVIFLSWQGCAINFGGKRNPPEVDSAVQQSDIYEHESRTLSNLATLENGVNDYIRDEKKIPEKLEDLIPKYLAEIPQVELGRPDVHSDTNKVEYYRGRVIQNGRLDESQLKDTGSWGYAHNDRQVIVFVDCTHENSRGRPWYKERGAF